MVQQAGNERNRFQAEQRWRTIFAEQARSGLTVTRFCREHGIAKSSFYAWRKVLANNNAKSVVNFAEVEVTNVNLNCELESKSAAPITIHLANDDRLEVPPGFDPQTLREILNVLRGAAC